MFSLVWGLELLLNRKTGKLFHKSMNHPDSLRIKGMDGQYMAGVTLAL